MVVFFLKKLYCAKCCKSSLCAFVLKKFKINVLQTCSIQKVVIYLY